MKQVTFAVAVLASFLSTCLAEETPTDVVKAICTAMNEGKYSAAREMLSEDAKQAITGDLGQLMGGWKAICDEHTKNGTITSIDGVSEDIRGEGAVVVVDISYEDGSTKKADATQLLLENGKWRVTLGNDERGSSPRRGAPKKPSTPTTRLSSVADSVESEDSSQQTNQAIALVDADFIRHWTKISNGFIAKASLSQDGDLSSRFELFQQRGPIVCRVSTWQLTESDKLNGLEWSGVVEYSAAVSRVYRSEDGILVGKKGWSEWREGSAFWRSRLEKSNGRWTLKYDSDDQNLWHPLAADEVPADVQRPGKTTHRARLEHALLQATQLAAPRVIQVRFVNKFNTPVLVSIDGAKEVKIKARQSFEVELLTGSTHTIRVRDEWIMPRKGEQTFTVTETSNEIPIDESWAKR